MAKGSRGGKRTGSSQSSVVSQQSVSTLANFMGLDDDGKVTSVINGISDDVPDFLSDSAFQRFMYNNELDGKPQIVDDKTLDSMSGQDIFRTVNSVYDSRNDVGYSALEIAQQIQYGDFTRFSDTGGSVYGKGLYFSNDYFGSTSYGYNRNNVKKTAVVRCKLNQNAKIIDYGTLGSMYRTELNSGTKLATSLSKAVNGDTKSALSIFALSKGYNVITSSKSTSVSDTYFNILDRSVLTMSSDVKGASRSWN